MVLYMHRLNYSANLPLVTLLLASNLNIQGKAMQSATIVIRLALGHNNISLEELAPQVPSFPPL